MYLTETSDFGLIETKGVLADVSVLVDAQSHESRERVTKTGRRPQNEAQNLGKLPNCPNCA